ncbi:hypothetical protein SFUMM280S_09421 [Streptomyces fumanus]
MFTNTRRPPGRVFRSAGHRVHLGNLGSSGIRPAAARALPVRRQPVPGDLLRSRGRNGPARRGAPRRPRRARVSRAPPPRSGAEAGRVHPAPSHSSTSAPSAAPPSVSSSSGRPRDSRRSSVRPPRPGAGGPAPAAQTLQSGLWGPDPGRSRRAVGPSPPAVQSGLAVSHGEVPVPPPLPRDQRDRVPVRQLAAWLPRAPAGGVGRITSAPCRGAHDGHLRRPAAPARRPPPAPPRPGPARPAGGAGSRRRHAARAASTSGGRAVSQTAGTCRATRSYL